jgi:N-acetylglucosaminyldiphosphoundecaprenol N-acetyl-beta-D-mannosaminyltransferase
MPLVWAARWAGVAHMGRVYGPDLMLALCALAAERAGPRPSPERGRCPGAARQGLAVRFPGLLVPGTMSLPFRPLTSEEDAAVIERINAATPGLVWVGLSTPNQER